MDEDWDDESGNIKASVMQPSRAPANNWSAPAPEKNRRYNDGYGGNQYDRRQNDSRGGDRQYDRGNNERRQNDYRGERSYDNRNRSGDRGRDQGGFNRSFERRDNNSGGYNDGDKSETFEIKSYDAGTVIGKGGSKIREIQDKFGVRINIDKDSSDLEVGQARCKVSGRDMTNVKSAVEYIKEMLPKDEPANNDYQPFTGVIDWDAANARAEEARKERWSKCPTLIKNFYKEDPVVAGMSQEEVDKFRREKMSISVARTFPDKVKPGDTIPNPVQTFEQAFHDYPDLLEEIRKAGFTTPSPIQSQAWLILLKGEDLIGIAQTGIGKTLAFLLPALIHIDGQPIDRNSRGGPNVLIMAPTRELALQIEQEVFKYKFRDIKAACLYGGGERNKQIGFVKAGIQIIIATPGRLNDLVAAKVLDITSITYLVLDEADRMLDMGFEPQIRKLLLDIRPDRQTVMTSATWPPGVRRLASSYMDNPIQVHVGSLDLAATHTVTQIIEIVDDKDKFERITEFIRNMTPTDKVIIFSATKARADDLSSDFALMGVPCQSIHGNREQSDREQALADIKDGTVRILVATDVASRGLDIEDITHVINMDFPRNIEEYVHRVGRTGRAGRTGIALSYFTRSNWGSAAELIAILEEADQAVPDELRDMAERFRVKQEQMDEEKRLYGNFGGGGRGRGDRSSGGGFGGGGFGGGGGNRSGGDRGGAFKKELMINSGQVGMVIGRGGSMINEIQQKFNVSVNVDKNHSGGQAQVNISGNSDDDVQKAYDHIQELCSRDRR